MTIPSCPTGLRGQHLPGWDQRKSSKGLGLGSVSATAWNRKPQPILCPCVCGLAAWEAFIVLKGYTRWKKTVWLTCKSDKNRFLCPLITFPWNVAIVMPCIRDICGCTEDTTTEHRSCNRPYGPQSLQYLLAGPLQKKSAHPLLWAGDTVRFLLPPWPTFQSDRAAWAIRLLYAVLASWFIFKKLEWSMTGALLSSLVLSASLVFNQRTKLYDDHHFLALEYFCCPSKIPVALSRLIHIWFHPPASGTTHLLWICVGLPLLNSSHKWDPIIRGQINLKSWIRSHNDFP